GLNKKIFKENNRILKNKLSVYCTYYTSLKIKGYQCICRDAPLINVSTKDPIYETNIHNM
ncbi:hypothetical protein MJM25_27300, partial [Salmonella enterica subsp. enterica serovar Lubbock]|nr:hypothetical protein [Salmonella enterica subsp. enterica serovar Lubbock]